MFRALKEGLVAAAVKARLDPLLKDYCDMLRIDMDSQAKRLVLETLPKGEAEMLRIELHGYSLERVDGKPVLRFEELRVSREWLQQVAALLLPDKRIVLPDGVPLDLLKAFT